MSVHFLNMEVNKEVKSQNIRTTTPVFSPLGWLTRVDSSTLSRVLAPTLQFWKNSFERGSACNKCYMSVSFFNPQAKKTHFTIYLQQQASFLLAPSMPRSSLPLCLPSWKHDPCSKYLSGDRELMSWDNWDKSPDPWCQSTYVDRARSCVNLRD